MTRKEALAEAQKRWGKKAQIVEYVGAFPSSTKYGRYRVYANIYGKPTGSGDSWEEAFANAREVSR